MPTRYKVNQWRAHKMIDGLRRTKVFNTKDDAKKWEAEQNLESWTAVETQGVTVLEWINRYLDDAKQRYTSTTYSEKISAFKDLLAFVEKGSEVPDITADLALSVLSHVAKTRSGYAANKNRKNYSAAWVWGQKFLNLPIVNPFKAVDRFREDRSPRYVPSVHDMERVLDNEAGEVRTFLMFLLHTGARRGEVFRLLWEDIDWENQSIRLGTRKRSGGGMEYDTIPMTPALGQELLGHMKNARSEWVFCGEDGEQFKYRQHLMKKVCQRAGVRPFGFHSIRHLTASMLSKSGVDIAKIQQILRHKSAAMTARYLHTLGVSSEVRDALAGALQRKDPTTGNVENEPKQFAH